MPLAGDVEEDPVVAEDGVGDAVAVVVDGAEPAAAADQVGVVLRVAELGPLRSLRGRQPPGLAQNLLRRFGEEGCVNLGGFITSFERRDE